MISGFNILPIIHAMRLSLQLSFQSKTDIVENMITVVSRYHIKQKYWFFLKNYQFEIRAMPIHSVYGTVSWSYNVIYEKTCLILSYITLQWLHNERDGVSSHRRLDCLLNRFFQAQIEENAKALRH